MSAIEFSTSRENISSNGELSFVEGLPSPTGRDAAVGQGAAPSLQRPLAIIRPLMGLLSTGGGNFAHIRKFSSAPVFLPPMGEPLPSQESFRQRNNLPRLFPQLPSTE